MEQTKCKNNGFTYVNTPGTSVVYYCLSPYETLDNNQNFEVSHVSHLLNVVSVIGSINSETGTPDLSYLTLDLKLDQYKRKAESKNIKLNGSTYTVNDKNTIPEDFLHTQQENIENFQYEH